MNKLLTVDEVLDRVKTLPALPEAVLQLDIALRDDNASTDAIVRLVSSDQALTLTALKLANSSFYGVSGRVVTLRDAVQILGMQTLSAVVMTAAVMARFNAAACPGYDFKGSWRHALATALCAQMLAESRGVDECAAYTAGLLHDIGSLALATYFPEPFAATIAWSAEHDMVPAESERELLGIDHAAVGAAIANHWKLAPVIANAIGSHHHVGAGVGNVVGNAVGRAVDNGGNDVIDVLHLADNITHALDLSCSLDDMVPPLSVAAWGRIGPTGPELQEMFERIETRMHNLDLGVYL